MCNLEKSSGKCDYWKQFSWPETGYFNVLTKNGQTRGDFSIEFLPTPKVMTIYNQISNKTC